VTEGPTAFERVGGEAKLRAIVDDFVGRMFGDVMIGFFFRNADEARIKEFEYQHAAEHLGGPVRYQGRPLRQAHAAHPIMGGQFARRKEILRRTLIDHGAPQDVIDAWLAHTESLRDQITAQPDDQCID
jgi:hemoglobin